MKRTELERAAAVRRNGLLLTAAQACLWAVLGIVVANGPLAIVGLTGTTSLAGVLIAVLTVSEAVGAVFGGRIMDRSGRRLGLALGYVLMAAGGGLAAPSVADSPVGVMAGTVLVGLGAGAALLARGAVAEMHPASSRGRAVGRLLVAGTVGAVGAPLLVGLLATAVVDSTAALLPWLLVPLLAGAGLACVVSMRPDPRELAVVEGSAGASRRPLRAILSQRPVRAALTAVAAAQVVMVSVMGVATIVIHEHGGGHLAASSLVSVHLAGMFAFTPLIGAAADRWGRRRTLLAGLALCAAGALAGAAAGGLGPFGVGFFLIGFGWSAAYVGSTAVASDLTTAAERGQLLGMTDLLTHSCSAVGGIMGGLIAAAAGFAALGVAAAGLAMAALLPVLRLREAATGRWDGALETVGPSQASL